MRRCLLIALLAVGLLGAVAYAAAFDRVFKAYQETGRIDPCRFSEKELEQASSSIPNDIDAYAPDFRNALQAALEQRAAGGCRATPKERTGTTGATGAAPTATTPAPPGGTPAAPGSTVTPSPPPDPTAAPAAADQAIARTARRAQASDAGVPAPVVALGVLGTLLALGGLGYGLAHLFAWDPRWARRARHALGEAGWRASSTWSDFADWARPGR